MTDIPAVASLDDARALDAADPLGRLRDRFAFPTTETGAAYRYFCGNSLGLMPKAARAIVTGELDAWSALGVEGHFEAERPWFSYDEPLRARMADVVGARRDEVALMNSLTTNLHLLMVSFYRPTDDRFKIVIEGSAFPSDRYTVASQAAFHGHDSDEAIVELQPRPGEDALRTEDILQYLRAYGHEVALVMLGGVNYYTGEYVDIEAITRVGHDVGAIVGFDLAHAAGNIALQLHEHDVDFAAWCTYKYLNAGPGAVGACFVHDRHAERSDLPRFAGWWGNDPDTRFTMPRNFLPRRGAAGWSLSNVPVLSMAPLYASLELFAEATMPALAARSSRLTGALEAQVDALDGVEIITPRDPARRGCQLSLRLNGETREGVPIAKRVHAALRRRGVIVDFRVPDVLRVAPVPLYTSFEDVYVFVEILAELLSDDP